MLNKIINYFKLKTVDKEYIIEYYIKMGDYVERVIFRTENTNHDDLLHVASETMLTGFHQDSTVYSPNVINKALIKEK